MRGLLALTAYPSSSTAGARQVNTHSTYVNPLLIEQFKKLLEISLDIF